MVYELIVILLEIRLLDGNELSVFAFVSKPYTIRHALPDPRPIILMPSPLWHWLDAVYHASAIQLAQALVPYGDVKVSLIVGIDLLLPTTSATNKMHLSMSSTMTNSVRGGKAVNCIKGM
jgi:hypothetical protein